MTSRVTTVKPKSRFRFITEIIAELRKVVWLSRREALYLSGLVILVSIAAGIVLGLVDYGFTNLIDVIIGIR